MTLPAKRASRVSGFLTDDVIRVRESLEQQAMSATRTSVEQLLRQEEKLARLEQQVAVEQSKLHTLMLSRTTAETALNQLNEQIRLRETFPLPQFSVSATGQHYLFTEWPPVVHQTTAGNNWASAPIRPVD